jgi:periplasmic divalent cation tolerance protein
MSLLIAWTTVATAEDASRLAHGAVQEGFAVCVQVDGPIESWYRWAGKVESTREYRLMFKLVPDRLAELEQWVSGHHPYEVPEWVVAPATSVSEKYLSWARGNSTPAPFHSSPPSP